MRIERPRRWTTCSTRSSSARVLMGHPMSAATRCHRAPISPACPPVLAVPAPVLAGHRCSSRSGSSPEAVLTPEPCDLL